MQLGLYLPGPLRALSGVQSLRILDSYELRPSHFPVTTASVRGDGYVEEPPKAGGRAMVAEGLITHDFRELLEVRLLRGEHGVSFKEGQDAFEQVVALSHNQDERSIAFAIRLDVTASEPHADQFKHLDPVAVLADMERRYKLKSDPRGRAALHRDRETPFSVYVTRDVAIQPFLLIVRTRHVVTIVNVRPDV